MRTRSIPAVILTLLALTTPAARAEEPALIQVAHEEVGQTLDDLTAQLHSLGARWREHFMHPGARGEHPGERPLITLMLRFRDELGLSPEQVQALERLRADFQRQAIRGGADLRIAELELANLLNSDQADLAQVEARVREIERLRAELRLARIRTIEQGKAQLTPEQRAKLKSLSGRPHPSGGARL